MNVEKGDLAIIIDPQPGFGGKVVEVQDYCGPSPASIDPSPLWWVKSAAPFDIGLGMIRDRFLFPDARLRRVSGLPDTEDTDTEQPIKEVV